MKEAIDNALDACEESTILPDILVEIKKIEKDEYVVIVEDNGPGIVKKEIPNIGFYAHLLDPDGNIIGLFQGLEKKE